VFVQETTEGVTTVRRLYPALTGLVLAAGLLVTTAVAQAAPTSPGSARVSAARSVIRSASTASPSISPAAFSVTHLPPFRSSYSCPSAEICLQVYDPATEGTTVFDLFYCRTYTLFNWNDSGTYEDNQTPRGTESIFIGPPNTDVFSDGGQLHSINWTPYNQIVSC